MPASVALLVVSQYVLPGHDDRRVWVRASDVILPVKYDFGFFTGFLPVFLPTSCKLFFVYKQCFSVPVVWQLANYL